MSKLGGLFSLVNKTECLILHGTSQNHPCPYVHVDINHKEELNMED